MNMNKLLIGLAEKTPDLTTEPGFLLIDDGPIADVFLKQFKRAKLFDPREHGFNPLPMAYRKAREFASVVYPDKDLMTYEDGKRALARMLIVAKSIDRLPVIKHKGYEHARDTIDDLLLSPVLKNVLSKPTPRWLFSGSSIVARINRADIGEHDAHILASLLISQFKGQIIVPDFGFYARPFHSSLIREGRLIAGVYTLSEIEPKLRNLCLLVEKVGRHCTYDDAVVLAEYEGLRPDRNDYNAFIDARMAA